MARFVEYSVGLRKPEQVKASFDTNVFGTLSVVQAAMPILRAQASCGLSTYRLGRLLRSGLP
jgi:hypothetical protein